MQKWYQPKLMQKLVPTMGWSVANLTRWSKVFGMGLKEKYVRV